MALTALTPGAIDQGGDTQRSIRYMGRGRDEMNITSTASTPPES